MSAAAAAAFWARDRAGRAAVLAAAGTAVLLPRTLLRGDSGPAAEGFRAGLEAGPGGSVLAGLWGVFLVAGVLVLWQGVVASDVESGRFRTTLARPVWRPGVYLARHAGALVLLALAAAVVLAVLRAAGGEPVPDPGGLVLAALLTGWAAGALLLLLSSLLDRGDVLACVALLLAPGALEGAADPAGPLATAAGLVSAALPPMLPLAGARRVLLAGGWPDGHALAAAVAYGASALALAALRLHWREYRAG